jgi:hypothetical protein
MTTKSKTWAKDLEKPKYFPVLKAAFCVKVLFGHVQFLLSADKRFRLIEHVHGAPMSFALALCGCNDFFETAKGAI